MKRQRFLPPELLSRKRVVSTRSPESGGQEGQTLEALKKITSRGGTQTPDHGNRRPLLDRQESEDVLKELVEIIPGARVFLIFTYRPVCAYLGQQIYHSQVT
jgi:hypothetical protein